MRGDRYLFDEERCRLVFAAPTNLLAFEAEAADAATDSVVVAIVGENFGIAEELEFLHTLLFHGTEILLMGSAKGG